MVKSQSIIRLKVKPKDIAFLVQVIEGYGHIGVVTTSDPKLGEVVIQVTPDTYLEAQGIVANLPLEYTVLDCN
ncbi:MAG: DUF4911 domain-containing protein [Peptococcaceae bacterium]|nr:DUF4911 domain-containing protein [Peptococcaceae bacterium]